MADKSKQEKMVYMQILMQQMKQMEKQLEQMEMQLQTVQEITESLKGFQELKEGDPILFPFQNGIFAEAKMGTNRTLRINVGADTIVEKTPEETIAMMEEQKKQFLQQRDEQLKEFQGVIKQLGDLEKDLA